MLLKEGVWKVYSNSTGSSAEYSPESCFSAAISLIVLNMTSSGSSLRDLLGYQFSIHVRNYNPYRVSVVFDLYESLLAFRCRTVSSTSFSSTISECLNLACHAFQYLGNICPDFDLPELG